MTPPSEKLAGSLDALRSLQQRGVAAVRVAFRDVGQVRIADEIPAVGAKPPRRGGILESNGAEGGI